MYKDGDFTTVAREAPKPEAGKVLIKVITSAINPCDNLCKNAMRFEGYPLGSEGSGTIVAVGDAVS